MDQWKKVLIYVLFVNGRTGVCVCVRQLTEKEMTPGCTMDRRQVSKYSIGKPWVLAFMWMLH